MPHVTYGWAAPSKLLQKKWHERQHRRHQQKIMSMKSGINNTKPKEYPHMVLRLKKYQQQEERQAEIDHQNNLLLTRMTDILQKPGRVDNWNEYHTRSLNKSYREREQEKIFRENLKIAQYLQQVKPMYDTREWEEDYGTRHGYLLKMWSKSTKDFPSSPRLDLKGESKDHGDYNYESDFEDDESGSRNSEFRQEKVEDEKGSKISINKSRKPNRKDTIAESDAKLLFKATKGLLPLEAILVQTLIRRPHNQRMTTLKKFDDLYDLNLLAELKGELETECHTLLEVLLSERSGSDTQAVAKAIHDNDTVMLTQLISSKEPSALRLLNKAYQKRYDVFMQEDIQARVLDDGCQALLITLLQSGRPDSNPDIDSKEIDADALLLFESGEGRFIDETGSLMKLIKTRHPSHVRSVFDRYKMVSGGETVVEAMHSDGCSTEYITVISNLEKCFEVDSVFWSEKIHKQLKPNNPDLIRMLLDLSDEDVPSIKKTYRKKYKMELAEAIMNRCGKKAGLLIAQIVMRFPSTTTKLTKPSMKKVIPNSPKKTQTRPKQESKHLDAIKDSPFSKTSQGGSTNRLNQGTQLRKQSQSPRHVVQKQTEESGPSSRQPAPTESPGKRDVNKMSKNAAENKPSATKPTKKESEMDYKKVNTQTGGTNEAMKSQQVDTNRNKSPNRKTSRLDKRTTTKGVEDDVDRIHEAIKGWGTDEEPLIQIITQRNNEQRQQLKTTYKEKFQKDLEEEMLSELSGDFEELILALLRTPSKYDAHCLRNATKAIENCHDIIIGIATTRSSKELKDIKTDYQEVYGRDLQQDLQISTTSDLMDILVALMEGSRDDGSSVDEEIAKEDVDDLTREVKSGFREENGALKRLLTKRNSAQLQITMKLYDEINGMSVEDVIKDSNFGSEEESYLSLLKALKDPVSFYAERLHNAMDNVGTDESKLIQICVSRSEIDLASIKSRYFTEYEEELEDVISRESSGNYKDLLLTMIRRL